MRKLLTTSALVVPLLAMPAYAQDAPAPAEDDAAQAQQLPPAGEGEDAGANVEVIPAEEADVEIVQEGEEPEEPVAAEEPMEPADPATTAEEPMELADPAMTAEEPMEPEAETAEETAPTPDAVVMEMGSDELRGDWVIGTTVVSPQDETIGQIQDVIITPDGQVTTAILSVGGFLGLGAKNIAVNWQELQIAQDGQEITLNLTREEAEAAPEYAFRDQVQPAQPAGADPAMAPAPAGDPGMAPAPGGDPAAPGATAPAAPQ